MKGKAAFTFIFVVLFVAGSAGMSEQDHCSSLCKGNEVPGVFVENLPDNNTTYCEGDERNGSENGGEDPAGSTDTNGSTPCVLDSPAQALFDESAVNDTPSFRSFDSVKQKVSAPSAEGELIVTFRTEPGKGMDKAAVDSAHKRVGASLKKDFSGKGLLGTQVVKIPPGLTIDEAIALYEGDVEVLSVQPNYRIELMEVPDDPDFSLQWALLNPEHPGADIGAVYAWDITNGDGGVLIAIPDTGIGVSHPDLADNIWFNTDEIFGNEIDDDGNGYIDDVQGWDFVNGDADPSDDNGHGTHVAGIVGAVGNNGIGISGVMWDTRILPLKVIGKDGYGYESDAIEAILYAQSVGAHIISISWGSYGESQALKDAIDHYPGLVVCAAGNSARDNDLYPIFPASFSSSNIISVTATDEQDGLASFANYGAGSVDIAAPGVGIYSTVPGSGYDIRSGTSMAAPYVTGAAGLVLSVDGDLDGPELVEILRSSVDHLDSLEGKVSFSGRVNAEKALLLAMGDVNITPLPTMPSPTPSVTVTPTQIPVPPGGGPKVAPLNPDFITYLKSYQTGTSQAIDERYGLGYIPAPLDMSYLQGQILQFSENTLLSLPTHYDLRTLDRVTPVGNQGPCGSCWAFATYGSMESVLMPGEEWHLSENNLKNLNGFDNSPCEGGNYEMSTAYLTRWDGPVTEASDPYNPFSGVSPTGIPPAIHVQDVLFIPMRNGPLDNDNIKNAIMTYGGVGTGFFWKDTYYSPSYSSYYYSGSKDKDNHAVTLVGWNDDYSKKKFTYRPPGNGAFLVKNSWGTSWGNGGYFWVSYYDNRIGRYFTNAVFLTEPTNNYDDIYQYDPLGWVSSIGYGSTTAWGANVFTSAQNEQLRAVGFYAASPNTAYEAYVYKNPTSGPMSPEGEVSFISGTIAIPGYHTLPLDTPVAVNAGETFSIVVKLVTPGNKYPIPFESPIFGYSSRATAEPGQSYISYDGSDWQDLFTAVENANVCVKGYTQDERWHVGVFRGNIWYLDYNGNGIWDGGVTDRAYNFGLTGDIPVSGDWTGIGRTCIGVYRPSTRTFYLDWNGNGVWDGGATDRAFSFGLTDDIPVTGDWDALGKTSIGVYRPSTRTFYLDWNGNGRWDGGVTDRAYNFGLTGDIPVSGDWTGIWRTCIGVYRPSTRTFYLDWNGNGVWDGGATDRAFSFGLTDDIPVTGDWDALGKTSIGVFRPSTHTFYLDWNGNGVWNGPATDRQYTFGLVGDDPATGAW